MQKELERLSEDLSIEYKDKKLEILTPLELINRHHQKLKLPLSTNLTPLDNRVFKKPYDAADLIIFEDTELVDESFIEYLKYIQKKSALLLVNDKESTTTFSFLQSYQNTHRKVSFHQTNPHAKALHIIATLLQTERAKDILVISNTESQAMLQEDLDPYIEEKSSKIEANSSSLELNFNAVLLTTYDAIAQLKAKHVILLDTCMQKREKLLYAYSIATDSLHILYEEECDKIRLLKEKK
jgi:hypothetical protein